MAAQHGPAEPLAGQSLQAQQAVTKQWHARGAGTPRLRSGPRLGLPLTSRTMAAPTQSLAKEDGGSWSAVERVVRCWLPATDTALLVVPLGGAPGAVRGTTACPLTSTRSRTRSEGSRSMPPRSMRRILAISRLAGSLHGRSGAAQACTGALGHSSHSLGPHRGS